MEYLLRADLILINRMTIEVHGGGFTPPENLLNAGSLGYVLEAVQAEIFGQKLHPTAAEIAAVYLHHIILGHIFQDGNKRTGLEAALLFLRLNDYRLQPGILPLNEGDLARRIPAQGDTPNQILFEFVMEVASGKHALDVVKAWFEAHTSPR
ncbi:MAG: hypothetical protein OHK0039_29290 [Bacteroidia bacterium]